LILVLVELLELGSTELHFRRKGASSSVLLGPVTIGEDLSVEFDSINDTVVLLLLELIHQILG
jgi:hypothetical protein